MHERALKVVAATECTGRRNSGWCVTRRSAPQASASSATSSTGSTASSTLRTGASGSPATSPTASQSSAVDGGYSSSSVRTTRPSVGCPPSAAGSAGGVSVLGSGAAVMAAGYPGRAAGRRSPWFDGLRKSSSRSPEDRAPPTPTRRRRPGTDETAPLPHQGRALPVPRAPHAHPGARGPRRRRRPHRARLRAARRHRVRGVPALPAPRGAAPGGRRHLDAQRERRRVPPRRAARRRAARRRAGLPPVEPRRRVRPARGRAPAPGPARRVRARGARRDHGVVPSA